MIDICTEPSYQELSKQHQTHLRQDMKQLSSRMNWDRQKLELFQLAQLKSLLVYARQHSRFYRHHLHLLDINKINSINDLQWIKPITKSDVMNHWDDIVCTPDVTLKEARQHLSMLRHDNYLKNHYHILSTSASSGKPGIFCYGWDEWPTYLAGSQRWINTICSKQGLVPDTIVSVQIGPHIANHMTAALYDTFNASHPLRHRISVFEPIATLVQKLNEYAPELLSCYPSTMLALLQNEHQKNLQIEPRVIVLNSETLSLTLRQRVGERWPSAIVLNLMGSTEGGVMAINCEAQSGLHLNEDLIIIEPVTHQGLSIKPGSLSDKFYLTNLFNKTFPLIRYEMQDQICFAKNPCPCGSAYQLIAEPHGREADIFVYSNQVTILCDIVLGGVLDRLTSLSGFHVWQTAQGIELGILAHEYADTERLKVELYCSLKEAGLENPIITIKRLEQLIHGKTGKILHYIPLLPLRSPL